MSGSGTVYEGISHPNTFDPGGQLAAHTVAERGAADAEHACVATLDAIRPSATVCHWSAAAAALAEIEASLRE